MNKNLATRTIVFILIIGVLIFMLFPFVVMISTAFKNLNEVSIWPPKWIPEVINWKNFSDVWKGTVDLKTAFKNSIIVSLATMGLCTIMGCLGAYSVSRYNFKGKKAFMFLMIMTQMFSAVILVAPMFQIVKLLGLLDTHISLIIANTAFALPMTTWLLTGYFDGVSESLEEAAMIDGCSRLQAVRKILVPVAAPGILTSGLFSFIMAWNDLIFVQRFTTKVEMRTLTIALVNYRGAFETYWNKTMAASLISVIPVFILFLFVQKYLVKGLSSGAVKE
ncbi:MAG: carbohydrate ABC transporter permease [Andreesenia angusta]|nr:carbohydrate ABC transporter permease [Andreesenia angusta]